MTDPSHRHGTFNVVWTKGGQPLDRWQRDVEAVREHAEFVAGKAEELRAYVASLDDVFFGRETGPRFWSRFKANIAALERVVERDTMYVELLEQLAAREAAKRAARLPPGLPVGPFGGPGGTPTLPPARGGPRRAHPVAIPVQ